jgi:phage repressor protein C with HTH and peptisase S24 domain
MEYKGLNPNSITVSAGLSVGLIGKAIKNEGGLNSDTIEKILHTYDDLNPIWFVLGDGDMLKPNVQDLKHNESVTKSVTFPDKTKNIKNVTLSLNEPSSHYGIPLIPIEAMGGFGTGGVQVMDYDTQKYIVPEFTELNVDFMIRVKGSSMYPKYNSGDLVACKKLVLSDIFFQWNKVYVLDTDQGALIKRIKKGSDNHLLIVSDNPSYEPYELHLSKIHAIAIVLGVIRLE